MRTLPLRLSPIEGESLPGYVARYSHTFQFQPGDVIRGLGLDGAGGTVISAGRYGVALSAGKLADAAFATGIAPELLQRMLLSRYAGRAFEQAAISTDTALSEAAQGHEVLIRSSKFCPRCLRQNGAWLLRWQLGWSAACLRHGVLLVRVCPKCGTVPKAAPRESWLRDRHGELSDPTRCNRRLGRELCRTQLAGASTTSVTDEMLAAQLRIDTLLDGGTQETLAGAPLEPRTYLRCLHTLCKLALHTRLSSRRDAPPRSAGRRLLDDPAAIASALPQALRLAGLPDPFALADAARELADHRYQQDGLTLPLSKLGQVPEPVRGALRHALSETVWAPALSQIGLHPGAHRRAEDLDDRLRVRHVPQLFWAEDYQREISELFDFDDFTHRLGRRFCSVLLARMLAPLDWHAAVRYLDYPETVINDGYNTTFGKLRGIGRFDELARRVKRIANQHAEQKLIDYKQRRSHLSDWTGIDLETWPLLQPRPRPHRWRSDNPSRRARASVWLWCQLTNGHERAAPIALPTKNLAHQGEFLREALPDLRERLLILGELLLTTPADVRQTLPTRLAAILHEHGHLAENFSLEIPPLAGRLRGTPARRGRNRPTIKAPARVDPVLAERVLAHVSAHTGVDIPTIKTASRPATQTPPAITHARLLAAALFRRTALGSWSAIAATIGGGAVRLASYERGYQSARELHPELVAELELLTQAVENWQAPIPAVPTTPHQDRMQYVAATIKARATELLAAAHGPDVARRTSITLCRQHTDLTCDDIADLHGVMSAQTTFSAATVTKHRQDADYERRYQLLLASAKQLRQQVGFANANLKRGLTTSRTAT